MNAIRTCFKLYIQAIKEKLDDVPTDTEIEEYTIDDIRDSTNVLFMKYIVKIGNYSLFNSTTPNHAYHHLSNMIKDHYRELVKELEKQNRELLEENTKLKNDILLNKEPVPIKEESINDNLLVENINTSTNKSWFFG